MMSGINPVTSVTNGAAKAPGERYIRVREPCAASSERRRLELLLGVLTTRSPLIGAGVGEKVTLVNPASMLPEGNPRVSAV